MARSAIWKSRKTSTRTCSGILSTKWLRFHVHLMDLLSFPFLGTEYDSRHAEFVHWSAEKNESLLKPERNNCQTFSFHFMSRLIRKQVSLSSEVTHYHFKNRCLTLYSEQGSGCGVSMNSRHGTFEDFHIRCETPLKIILNVRRLSKTELTGTVKDPHITYIYLSGNMKCFCFLHNNLGIPAR